MKDDLRRKLATKDDRELERMVGAPDFARWAQEVAVELLQARGRDVTLPALAPSPPRPRFPWRKLGVGLGVAAVLGGAVAAYFSYAQHRRDQATSAVRRFVTQMQDIAKGLPAPLPAAGDDPDSFHAACAAPMAQIGAPRVIGFVIEPPTVVHTAEVSHQFSSERPLPLWSLVAAPHGGLPETLTDFDLARVDGDRHSSLLQQAKLAAFRYVAVSRVLDLVSPNITSIGLTGVESAKAPYHKVSEVAIQGELGHASVEVTIVELATRAVVCRGRIENVGPHELSSVGWGNDDKAALRSAVNTDWVASITWSKLTIALEHAWLCSLSPMPWGDVCPPEPDLGGTL